ncbi:Periplasmic pH-dependent serine endoprotease DegQ precursor [Roseivivax jejudonensis]|uniref:Periplasmic pH-dependent serine endoprotease DegQ n=1 Tax=Roseivivax jejudonensis TaxID=1529041 RepID=A0A1X7A8T2_9RHOB|nr:trypsin-like peptidase domain-containing protein [Roseivivax jejudonensis]SLN73370.1 Periplasmic pH-dependent serine endoprotease DegQ precursor [Roseivivax jejudonensis]
MTRNAILSLLVALCAAALPVRADEVVRVPSSRAEIALSFAPLVREAAPAVVNIYARRVVAQRSPFADDPFFGDFFRDLGRGRPRVQNSLGSGVILSEDGIVVSNYHVVGEAEDIRVVLNDRREYAARVLLGDEEADLAILRLEGAEDMPHLPLRDSDAVEVGELVLAIGNPFGVGQTVSSGIVSGLARSGTATGTGRGYFIQTDAPINPGNSGGALIDMQGRLIGVNTSILSRSGGSNGIGFAIPAALVAQFVAQAEAGHEQFARPWAGITGQPVDADLSASLGQGVPQGVLVSDVHPQSPFAAAGLLPGALIVAVDDKPVNTPAEVLYHLSVRGIGAESRVTVVRQGEEREITVALAAPPETPPRAAQSLGERTVLPGLSVARVNPAVIAELDLPLMTDGVAVLDPGPWGARAGLRRGDILRAVNGLAVGGPGDVAPALAAGAPRLAVEILRDGRRRLLRFRL